MSQVIGLPKRLAICCVSRDTPMLTALAQKPRTVHSYTGGIGD